ncbi:MAG: choice-of-anchor I family protein [Thalassotalea sp.]
MIRNKFILSALASLLLTTLTACDDGDNGVQGLQGNAGINGQNGVDGVDGQSGANGKDSFKGIEATLVARAVLNAESPEGAAEIVQYQKSTGYIFAINSSGDKATVEIIDMATAAADTLIQDANKVTNNTNLSVMTTIDLSNNTAGDANSLAISDQLELLAVAMAADTVDANGYIAFYDISGAAPIFIKNVEVGVLPDMVAFSPDSSKVVVANEGEPDGDYVIDPEGSISIINISNNLVADAAINLTFETYNSMAAELSAQGVMFANPSGRTINGSLVSTTVAMDLEPEYVAISADSKTAYVSMQENNALAVVDLVNDKLVDIRGLGFKDWSNLMIDASDKDGGINFKKYNNLYGMYQPDTIATISWQGADFIVTANEGDGREYFFDVADEAACTAANGLDYDEDDGCLSYTDEVRVEDLTLDPVAFAGVNNDDDDIGRLKVSIEKGDIDGDGDYDQLYTYGARSFSIFDANGYIIYDSGDDVGRITAAIHGEAFNNDEDENKGDTRSDAKGAEPEALAIGEIDGHTLAFVGLERMSGVMVYDVTNPFNVSFVDYFHNRGTVEGDDITGDLAPEGMKFIAATDEQPAMLIVGNEISGSIAVWQITSK